MNLDRKTPKRRFRYVGVLATALTLAVGVVPGVSLLSPVAQAQTVDVTKPTVTISTPTPAQGGLLQGTAADSGGIVAVQVIIYHGLNGGGGEFWNGTSWQAGYASVNAVLANPGATSTSWSYSFSAPGGSYYAAAVAIDTSYNYDLTSFVPFTLADIVKPTATITFPFDQQNVPTEFTVRGTASDNNRLWGVNVFLYRVSDGTFWNGEGWSTGFVSFPAELLTPGGATSDFEFSTYIPGSEDLLVGAVPIDENFNYSVSPLVSFRSGRVVLV
jgi:hypothetical protein